MRLTSSPLIATVALLLLVNCVAICEAQYRTSVPTHAVSATAEAIQQALSQPIEFPAAELPLEKFVETLMQQLNFGVVLDTKALEGAGVGTDTRVRSPVSRAALSDGLDLLLKSLALTWTIRNDTLLITTSEEQENQLETRIYPVGDLIAFYENGRWVEHYEPLMDALKSTVAVPKPGWVDDGGVGTLVGYPGGRLVCSQTYRVHDEVEGL